MFYLTDSFYNIQFDKIKFVHKFHGQYLKFACIKFQIHFEIHDEIHVIVKKF